MGNCVGVHYYWTASDEAGLDAGTEDEQSERKDVSGSEDHICSED